MLSAAFGRDDGLLLYSTKKKRQEKKARKKGKKKRCKGFQEALTKSNKFLTKCLAGLALVKLASIAT